MWEVSVNFSGMRGLCRNFSPMYQPGDVHSGPARAVYENASVPMVSSWYYDVGMSARTATEQRARQRAARNVQGNIAATHCLGL